MIHARPTPLGPIPQAAPLRDVAEASGGATPLGELPSSPRTTRASSRP